jgi:serine O-acetyltransferase
LFGLVFYVIACVYTITNIISDTISINSGSLNRRFIPLVWNATRNVGARAEMTNVVENILRAALMECCPPAFVTHITSDNVFFEAIEACTLDLHAFAAKDPASKGSTLSVAQGASSYKAVAHFRLAHALLGAVSDCYTAREMQTRAALLSCRGRLLSGAEIHPRRVIGKRLVLDHGWGTVIGETTRIGDDCYVLCGVTLGAAGIAGNPAGKRHPTIGDRVQIGAYACVFGDVTIGDDVVGPAKRPRSS